VSFPGGCSLGFTSSKRTAALTGATDFLIRRLLKHG
jgi:hypothetical protein